MTDQEYVEWINFHGALYTGFRDWFFSGSVSEHESRLNVWEDSLKRYSLERVTQASQAMANRPMDRQPRGFSQHLGELRELCKTLPTEGWRQYRKSAEPPPEPNEFVRQEDPEAIIREVRERGNGRLADRLERLYQTTQARGT